MRPWPSEAIWQAVVADLPDFSVEVLARIDSTNSELMRRAHAGRTEPVLLVAEAQTAGRGRLGRQWHGGAEAMSSAGAVASVGGLSALTFSLGLPLRAADWSGLSLAVGVSVAQSLHPELRLKWPNDIWLRERKLGGILIETASMGALRYAVIGVGINIAPIEAAGLRTPPAWLRELLPEVDAAAALLRLAVPLVQAVRRFEARGFAPFAAEFQARDALAGRAVALSDGTTGEARGVSARGALLVHTSAGMQEVSSSEVSIHSIT